MGRSRVRRNKQRERAREMARAERNAADMGDGANRAAREPDWSEWAGPEGELGWAIRDSNEKTLQSYQADPDLLEEHATQERRLSRGGYADRQIVELTQNSADTSIRRRNGHIDAVLTQDRFYFADDGEAVSKKGVRSLLKAYLSTKGSDDEIGQFGLGFKSLLRTSSRIEFISKSGSFRFDKEWARKQLGDSLIEELPDRVPIMRLAEPFDPRYEFESDLIAKNLAETHVNIVLVELNSDAVHRLKDQIVNFPVQFMLLVDHITRIVLNDRTREAVTRIEVDRSSSLLKLDHNGSVTRWRRFRSEHELSQAAIDDWWEPVESKTVTLTWVVPETARRGSGKFWEYFPTSLDCLVPGVLNGSWKVNPDRTSLLPGAYNDELIDAAATLIADNIGELRTPDDPARHIDALPAREDGDVDQTKLLRHSIFGRLNRMPIVPVIGGSLMSPGDVRYPPRELLVPTSCFDALNAYARSRFAPTNLLHASATSGDRWPRVEGLNDHLGRSRSRQGKGAIHPTVSQWLAALTFGKVGSDSIEASRDAIQVAAMLPEHLRTSDRLGSIFLTQSDEWLTLDKVFLPPSDGRIYGESGMLIHGELANDSVTVNALKTLGVAERSDVERLRDELRSYVSNYSKFGSNPDWCDDLWFAISEVGWRDAVRTIKTEVPEYRARIPARVVDGTWHPLAKVMMPGEICQPDSAPRVCVDTDYHAGDALKILNNLGVSDGPRAGFDYSDEPGVDQYEEREKGKFRRMERPETDKTPEMFALRVFSLDSPGPVQALKRLPEPARVKYTEALLSLSSLYTPWTVKHATQEMYTPQEIDSYALHFVREHGVVSDGRGGTVRLADAGTNEDAGRELQKLETWERIKDAFGFDDPPPQAADCEAIEPGEEERVLDIWPGLRDKVDIDDLNLGIARCIGIAVNGVHDPDRRSFANGRTVYVVWDYDDRSRINLESVNDAAGLGLSTTEISDVLAYEDLMLANRRKLVRECGTVEARLLAAVGERALRAGLPEGLVAYKERNGVRLSGIELANAAIATYDAGTLKHYRHDLEHLDPPGHWAGGPRALAFVRALGFPDEWAGSRNPRRDPFVEVDGPLTLKPLHDYQEAIARRIVDTLQPQSVQRRGMLSLPTGAGKTRVAVEGTVRALREHGSIRSLMWVADRDELCEQAVQSWIQVWSCFGEDGVQLRVSRMWEGQPPPEDTSQLHVIVASLQTLNAKLRSDATAYDFIKDVKLVIFDEAHRSIAPSFTNALNEIGYTPRQGMGEPYLIGLTATPYRGHNKDETTWLVNRYGSNRLDDGAFPEGVLTPQQVVEYLQGKLILARARHEEIEGGRFALNWEELQELQRTNLLSRSAEIKIARDTARTERIIKAYDEHVRSVDPHAPTIIFATSVEHAMTLAAELSSQGVPARAVSASTDRGTRRRIVHDFRREDGGINVLVNYGVFREGFDAPRTRVIIVARPVWSPNLYFQMIGRGLRGTANGGNEECLIINVRDNIENYERKLAFDEVDWLWD